MYIIYRKVRSALLLRLGDLELDLDYDGVRVSPDGVVSPSKLRGLVARLSGMQALVTRGAGRVLTSDYRLRKGARPHWLMPSFGCSLCAKLQEGASPEPPSSPSARRQPVSSTRAQPTPPGGPRPASPGPSAHSPPDELVVLAEINAAPLSLAVNEACFLQARAHEPQP